MNTEYNPDFVTPPCETIRETIEAKGMSFADFAAALPLGSMALAKGLVSGHTRISPGMAQELERILGVPASFWIQRQINYLDWIDRWCLKQNGY